MYGCVLGELINGGRICAAEECLKRNGEKILGCQKRILKSFHEDDSKRIWYCTLHCWSSSSRNMRITCKTLGPQLIKFPIEKKDVMESSSQFLHRFGFPQVIGCIMGPIYLLGKRWKMPMITCHTNYTIQSTVKLFVMRMGNLSMWK